MLGLEKSIDYEELAPVNPWNPGVPWVRPNRGVKKLLLGHK